jgi:hypothetical protein
MLNSSVLVLNRSYLPIHVTSARRAFSLIYRQTARAVNEEYETFDFEQWRRLEAAGEAIGTANGGIRVPRVIVLPGFDRIPKRHVRYSRVNVFARDKYTCQYCAIARGQDDVGERRLQLRRLQSAQRRPHPPAGPPAAATPAEQAALDPPDEPNHVQCAL